MTLLTVARRRKGLTRNFSPSAPTRGPRGIVNRMLVLAHRGANRLAPENTIAAMARAIELGADGVELDVHRTADHQLVVRHDAGGPAGVLCDLSLAEVRSALPDVPTLPEVLDVCRGSLVNIEVKNLPIDADWDPDDRAAALLAALLEQRGGADDVIVSSRNLATIDRMRALAPDLPTALVTRELDPLEGLEAAAAHGHDALHPVVWALEDPVLGVLTQRARERGLRVTVWTVNDLEQMRRLEAAGVDAVITDDSDLYLRREA
ncbi:MAG: glycerophosphoryl diester phosphodiesterase [Actinomycetota bacterium]|nr:glycerophosphoryl diester phosphodiesterase [Actinomycetota bacterium]